MAEEGVEPAGDDEAERSGERLLEEGTSDDGSGAVLFGDGGQGIAESVKVGKNRCGCGTKLEDEGGVDGVLTGGAPVDESGGIGVLPGDELGELFNKRDCKISGGGNRGGEFGKVEKFGATICGDDGRGGCGDDASFGFGASEGGFEIEHELDGSRVREEQFDGWGVEEAIEERHEESVNVPGRRKNDFVRREGVR